MKWLQQLSIYYKINGIIMGMLLLLSLIMGIMMIKITTRLLDQQIEQRGVEVATYIAVLSSNDILLDDTYALFERINKTKNNNDDVRYILVTDSAGRILANTFAGIFPTGLPLELPKSGRDDAPVYSAVDVGTGSYQVIKFNTSEGPLREIIVPIENGAVGYVRIGMSENSTKQLLDRTLNNFFITTIMVCLLALAGATYLAFVIINPLRALTSAAGQIQQGNLSVTAEVEASDEIGQLAVVFNDMINSLQEKAKENELLLDELRAKEAMRATLLNKLFTIQEEERKRISRELHDETSQSLASLLAYMKVLLSKLTDDSQKDLLLGARDVAINALDNLRKMAVELRPLVLDDLGIAAAMAKYISNFGQQHNMNVVFNAPNDKLYLSSDVSLALYRIMQESLTNIAKHAHATSLIVTLHSTVDSSQIILTIADNGHGLSPLDLENARKNNRLGVYGMKERAELLGGSFELHSTPQQGATLTVILPQTL